MLIWRLGWNIRCSSGDWDGLLGANLEIGMQYQVFIWRLGWNTRCSSGDWDGISGVHLEIGTDY